MKRGSRTPERNFAITAATKPEGMAAGRRGEALVELALIAPFVFFLVVLVINFAGLIGAWIEVANAARAAADYAILSGSSAGLPTEANPASLQSLITNDLAKLPGSSTNTNACLQVNNNGTITATTLMGSNGCASYSPPPSDGEGITSGSTTQYINLAVDITYTYAPFMVGSSFLGYFLPNIPTSVHQRSVMRVL
jgi:Flp pilus assembly protein TadG